MQNRACIFQTPECIHFMCDWNKTLLLIHYIRMMLFHGIRESAGLSNCIPHVLPHWYKTAKAKVTRQSNKIIALLTFPKWLVLVCAIHISLCMLQTETSHLWKVRYAIILLGWRNVKLHTRNYSTFVMQRGETGNSAADMFSRNFMWKQLQQK